MHLYAQDAEAYNQRNINEEGGGGYIAYVRSPTNSLMLCVLCTSHAGQSTMHVSLSFDLQAAQFIEHRHGTAITSEASHRCLTLYLP